jgi:hypothetical protein
MGVAEGGAAAMFAMLVTGLTGVAPELMIVVVVVEVLGDKFISLLPDAPAPEPDTNVITGAALMFGAVVDSAAFAKLGVVMAGMTTGVIVLAVVCGPIAVQGGPPVHPVMTNCPLTKLRL